MYRFGICWGGRDDRTPASELDTRAERVDERSRVSDFQASDQSSWLDEGPFSRWSYSIQLEPVP